MNLLEGNVKSPFYDCTDLIWIILLYIFGYTINLIMIILSYEAHLQ